MARTKTQRAHPTRQRDAIFKWNHSMRTAVYLITSDFGLTHHRRADVFNIVFADELAARQCPDGLRVEKVSAQAAEARKAEPSKCWTQILAPPTTSEEERLRRELRVRIRQAAQGGRPKHTVHDTVPSSSGTTSNGEAPSKPTAKSARERVQGSPLTDHAASLPSSQRLQTDQSMRPIYRKTLHKSATSDDANASITVASISHLHTLPQAPLRTPGEHVPMPSASKRRQVSDTVDLTYDDDDFREDHKRARLASAKSTLVPLLPIIKRREEISQAVRLSSQVPLTPPRTKAVRKVATPKEKFVLSRPDGSQIKPSLRRQAGTQKDLVPISPHIAEPPRPDLVFRYWVKQTPNNHNSEDGFTALKFFGCNVGHFSLLRSQDVDLTDVFNHMNRELVKSRFVSTCNRLVWVIRLAMNEFKKGITNGCISVIDPSVLKKHALLWARPFHDEITEKKIPWTNGAWAYRGSYEFLVQGAIPKEAVLSTIKVTDLYRLPQLYPALGHLLRLEIVMNSMSLANKEAKFRQQAVPLDSRLAKAIAQFTSFLGLTSDSQIAHISHIVADIVQGWHLSVVYREQHEWQDLATIFARSMLESSAKQVGLVQEQAMKMAFLDGVRWGQGEFNARHKPETVVKMQKRAKSIGLECPAKIVTDELAAVKVMVWSHENRIANMLKRYNVHLAVMDKDISGHEGEAMQSETDSPIPGPNRPPPWTWTRQLAIEEDDEVTFGDEIEFDDNGYVV